MARSRLQRRLQADQIRLEAIAATLKQSRRPQKACDYVAVATEMASVCAHAAHVIRNPADWRPHLKTHDKDRVVLAAARHLFARYPAPDHVERVWIHHREPSDAEMAFRKGCYFAVVAGASLYKQQMSPFLSRRETHVFLDAPTGLTFAEAIVYAVARSSTDDVRLAQRIATSKIAAANIRGDPFWREATRFFCAHPARREEIDDFCDFFHARLLAQPSFSLKGRTLASLRAMMAEWHATLMIVRRVGDTRWPGAPIPNWVAAPTDPHHPLFGSEWIMVQLTSGRELAEEGAAQRHCVVTYESACSRGRSSIWSLRRRAEGKLERVLTLEMSGDRNVIQIRGRANRRATPEERAVLRVWAAERGVHLV